MEADALSLALEQPQKEGEEEALLEFLSPPPDAEQQCSPSRPQGCIHVGAGLRNLGNTCFLNAVLQCFTHTPPLVNYLRNTPHATPCVNEGFCAFCALRGHVNTALSSSGGVIEPSELVDNLCNLSTSASFQKDQQEDAHEYMHCLLEALHKSLLPPKASQSCLLLEGESFVKNLFGGRLRSQIRCVNCSHCSDTFEPLIDLSLEIENANSITEALESFTRAETLECDAKYKCEKCKHGSSFSKRLVIDHAPEVLSIQLKRFINTGIIGSKVHKDVTYPQVLDLKPFTNDEPENQGVLKYELYGVLVHSGWTMYSGHYYCFVQTSPDVWHKLDDWQVTKVNKEYVLEQQAYILFYYRQGSPWFSSMATEKQMSVRSPKSVLDESNTSDDSDSLSDKECHKSNSNKQKQLRNEGEAIASSASEVSGTAKQDKVYKSNNMYSPTIDMQSIPVSPCFSAEKSCGVKPDFSSSSPAVGKSTTENSSLSEKRAVAESDLGICKTQGDDKTPAHSKKLMTEGDEDMPKFSKKAKTETDKRKPRKSSSVNLLNSNMICSQGTPSSINKVLSNMPGSRRACLMQYVQPNHNSFLTPVKESNPSHSRKKKNSPSKEHVVGKRQKQVTGNKTPTTGAKGGSKARGDTAVGSSEHSGSSILKEQLNFSNLDDDPYAFELEIEQTPQYTCKTSEARLNSKLDLSSFSSPAQ